MEKRAKILVIDDEGDIYRYGERFLQAEYEIFWVRSGPEAIDFLEKTSVDLILLDKNFSKIEKRQHFGPDPLNEGLYIHREIQKRWDIPTLLVTSYADPKSLSIALKQGVRDYIEWDALALNQELLKHRIERILREEELEREALIGKYNSLGLIGKTKKMLSIFRAIEKIAKSDLTVLITGETGTGKELVARVIHKVSGRKGSFVPLNLSALPKELVESELFGYKKGAFTGANQDKMGLFQVANNGTLFIDEISDLQWDMQTKLLRVLEEKVFFPLGSERACSVNARLITATNKPLEKLVKEKKFREDLFFRLQVFTIHMPTLKERREDIPLIVDYYVSLFSKTKGFPVFDITTEAREYLKSQDWPGNVRQLENTLLRALTYADKVLTLKDAVRAYEDVGSTWEQTDFGLTNWLTSRTLEEIEKKAILETLRVKNWNIREAAKSLGIAQSTLYNKIKEYGISRD
jgi:DNA-binding NtrC family response regulator